MQPLRSLWEHRIRELGIQWFGGVSPWQHGIIGRSVESFVKRNRVGQTIALPQPYDAPWTLEFLARRALVGVERVGGATYERVTDSGTVRVRLHADALEVELPPGADRRAAMSRLRALFDLDADPIAIDSRLARDAGLAAAVRRRPGLRVPGAWDPFELAVRAVLGQQVSVARATRLAQALMETYGEPRSDGSRAFPTPARLARDNPSHLGMPRRRGEAIRALAAAAEAGVLEGALGCADRLRAVLTEIPGIGPWTAEYVVMRAGRDADAFPCEDAVVCRVLAATPAAARRRAECWRPFRAYAVMHLWASAAAGQRVH
jgi:3-methyladenine DNA glycosylase/8-oxoguanine DNA glycosylase